MAHLGDQVLIFLFVISCVGSVPGGNGRVGVDRASAGCRSGSGEQELQLIVIDRLDQVMIKPSLL